MKQHALIIIIIAVIMLITQMAIANNIQVSNVSLTGHNIGNQHTMVQFDISWENSWRVSVGPSNWDAAWVFVKYSTSGGSNWEHAKLNSGGHIAPAGCIIDAPMDADYVARGAFIYRSSNGTGTVNFSGVQLRWMYGDNGVPDNAIVQVKVFAIEMVYVPTAAFAAGSGGTGRDEFTLTTINTANARTAPAGSGSLGGQAGGYPTGQTAPTFPDWPNGYRAFYCMKYEITQHQYVDFLNILTSIQAATRNPGPDVQSSREYRYSITGSHPNFSTSRPFVACNWLSWMDGCAYADWAALRPMTELEFEKACRGNQLPVPDEFAWGTTSITAASRVNNDGAANEEPGNTGANCVFGGGTTGGPIRVGCFATDLSTRELAGASFYGIMELSGNLVEKAVTLVDGMGRLYKGTVGDGSLSNSGDADRFDWPGFINNKVTGAGGSGFRGGDFGSNLHELRISDRAQTGIVSVRRAEIHGFRGVRSAP